MHEAGLCRGSREATRFYRLAAEQGDPAGQGDLGVLYATGRGALARNDAEAMRLWQLSAAQEDA